MCSWYIVDGDRVPKVVITEFHLGDDSARIPVSIHIWKRKKLIGWAVFTDVINKHTNLAGLLQGI